MSQDRWEISRIEALEKAAEEIQREKEALEKQHDRLLNINSDKSSEIFRLRGEKISLEKRVQELEKEIKDKDCEECDAYAAWCSSKKAFGGGE
jgi:hypothetical protein